MTVLRRTLLATGLAAPAAAGASVLAASSATALDTGRVPLARVDEVLGSVRLPLPAGLTRPMRTSSFQMLAVTWSGEIVPEIAVRTRNAETGWSRWRRLAAVADGPDLGSDEDNRVRGTDLLWVGPADGVQVRTFGASENLALVLVDPGVDEQRSSGRTSTTARPLPAGRMRPKLFTRRDWKANGSWRSGSASYGSTIRCAHVHHTVSSNGYSRKDVPGMIRGMYYYHTQQLGWSDIGYNFLIDRFGRIWIGRAGGGRKPVRGAHTRGFNQASFGVALIGTYTTTVPSAQAQHALVRLLAWKLNKYGRNPNGYATLTSEGSDRYPRGSRARLRVIDGHRDTNQTACPGDQTYRLLPSIRRRTAERIDRRAH